jgi:tetratricopeptide (TPR) repeat protein
MKKVSAIGHAFPGSGAIVLAFLAALAIAPVAAFADSAELHNTSGLAFYYQSKDSEAFAEFVKALEKDPSYAQPHFNLARLFERQKRFEEALRQFRDALQLDPSMALAREGVERMQTTLSAMGKPASPPPLPPGGLTPAAQEDQLAQIKRLIETNELKTARERLAALATVAPSNPDVLLLQADLAEKLSSFKEAADILSRVQLLLPNTAQVSYRLALCYYRIGMFDKAESHIERAMQLNPNKAEFYHLLGLVQKERGKPAEAYNSFQEASRLDPKNQDARQTADQLANKLGLYYYNSGLYYFQQQAWAKARDLLKRAIEKGNLNPEQSSIAQQYLVIAEFSAAKVADQIRSIQTERDLVERGYTQKRVTVPEAERMPATFQAGTFIDFKGWIVSRKDTADTSELIVTKNYREVENREQRMRDGEEFDGSFRSNARMTEWYTIRTPRVLPTDPRIAPSSGVRVKGKLGAAQYIRNPYNFVYSQTPQPLVEADYLEIYRELRTQFARQEYDAGARTLGESERNVERGRLRPTINTPPGLSGPLKIDFLRYNEEQLRNLGRSGEL